MFEDNPVIESCLMVSENSKYVKINRNNIKEFVKNLDVELKTPSWDFPPFPSREDEKERLVDVYNLYPFLVSINYRFWFFDGDRLKRFEVDGSSGAGALWKIMRKKYDQGDMISYFINTDYNKLKEDFNHVPGFYKRAMILKESARVLREKYKSSFLNLIEQSEYRIFGEGGVWSRLLNDFPFAFEDSSKLDGKPVYFYKKLQLLLGMLQGRFNIFDEKEVSKLTVYADYRLPQVLNHSRILEYSDELLEDIKNYRIIPKGSRKEIEIRANTIVASLYIEDELNKMGKKANGLNVDYLLWKSSRGAKFDLPHHLTYTSAY